MCRNMVLFYGEELLAPGPTPKVEDHTLSAVRDCLCNAFAATSHFWRPFLHPQPEDAPCSGNGVDLDVSDELLTIYSAFVKCVRTNGNTIRQCISHL
jgi:hypothetical protein